MVGKAVLWGVLCGLCSCADPASPPVMFRGGTDFGTYAKWAKIEIEIDGPQSQAAGDPNPFAIVVDVTFTGPSNQQYVVPAFYEGDGNGGGDGSAWRVRFSADEVGAWEFTVTSDDPELDNYVEGMFMVEEIPDDAPGFWRMGRLEYTGTPNNQERYLRFRDGSFWLKAGSDDPENLLGSFSNYDTPEERRDAIDYLASKGINSQYIMTHNVNGDDNDVWPWLGADSAAAMANGAEGNVRFEISRLGEWDALFMHMNDQGVVPYLVLEDDSPWTGYDHARYYREMIARFGYLPALLFNFGEEHAEANTTDFALASMQMLEDIDPYDHPRGIHNVNDPLDEYIDADQVDFTAIQTKGTNPLDHHDLTLEWIDACNARERRVLMVNYDEPRPEMDRVGWWSAYVAGGVWEVHVVEPYDQPFSAWETAFTELGGARAFMELHPFWAMQSSDELATAGFCLADPGVAYAVYLPEGGDVTVSLEAGEMYDYGWWDPGQGFDGALADVGEVEGGDQTFSPPGSGDWALSIINVDGFDPPGPGTTDTGDDSDSDAGDGTTDAEGDVGTGGMSTSGATPTGAADETAGGQSTDGGADEAGGCGCRHDRAPTFAWFVVLTAFLLRRRRC